MRVRLARTAGFCMGVKRAMEMALATANRRRGPIWTYGPLIHNPQVLQLLASKGVRVLEQIPPPGRGKGVVLVRAHGIAPAERRALEQAGFEEIVDCTCPRVIRVQRIIAAAAKEGKDIVIVGDPEHPEVRGLVGHAQGRAWVVSAPEDVQRLEGLGKSVVVAQTTQSEHLYQQVVEALRQRLPGLIVHRTICAATTRRQQETLALAREVDGVVVVGGRSSGNTRRLYEIARATATPTVWVESDEELEEAWLRDKRVVGLTAGASTPNWMIRRVLGRIKAARAKGEGPLRHWARTAFRALVQAQVWVGLGAGGMTLGACALEGIRPPWALVGVGVMYAQAMHLLNHFVDRQAGEYNDPERARFLMRHRRLLVGMGMASALGAVGLCMLGGWKVVGIVVVMSVLGVSYGLPVLPRALGRRLGGRKLKDIPGSKTLGAALAWAVICALLGPVWVGGAGWGGVVVAGLYVAVMVLVRCMIFDLMDVQGDLIVGKETIPIVLGERRTRRLMRWLLAGLGVVVAIASWAGVVGEVGWWELVAVGWLGVMELMLEKGVLLPGPESEALVDGCFLIAGVAGVVWG